MIEFFFHRDEYNRNRARIMEISSMVDAERTDYSQLKDDLIIEYKLHPYFNIEKE